MPFLKDWNCKRHLPAGRAALGRLGGHFFAPLPVLRRRLFALPLFRAAVFFAKSNWLVKSKLSQKSLPPL